MQKTSQQDSNVPEAIRGDEGASILGPRNVPIERLNPDILIAPTCASSPAASVSSIGTRKTSGLPRKFRIAEAISSKRASSLY